MSIITNDTNRSLTEIVCGQSLILLASWFLPLFLIFSLANILNIKSKLVLFTVVYNWLQAFINLCSVPLSMLSLLFPNGIEILLLPALVLMIFLIYISFRVFDAVLQENIGFTTGLFLLYIFTSICGQLIISQLFR